MKEIKLTQGQVAFVDDEDYERLSQYKWSAIKASPKHPWYAVTNMHTEKGRRSVRMHRVLLGAKSGDVIDHIDGNGLNNTRANLRFCSQSENVRNARKHNASVSKYKGVTPAPQNGRWRAQIQFGGKKIPLGTHASEEMAAFVYNCAALQYFVPYARLNELPPEWVLPAGSMVHFPRKD